MTAFPQASSASIEVRAAPEIVWELVADITRMGEWSPECVRAEWEDGATGPAVGATLTESFDAPAINVEGSPANFEGRFEMLVKAINKTISNIKTAAEATSG